MDINKEEIERQRIQKKEKDDNLNQMLKKWQKKARDDIRNISHTKFDFLRDPTVIMDKVKEETKNYVEGQWGLKSFYQKTRNIFSQFFRYSSPYNEFLKDQPSFILKTRRIEYVFERYRNIEDPTTISEAAELQFINEIKFWSVKYVMLSWIIGINSAFLGYHFIFKHLKLYIGVPLVLVTMFQVRNICLRNCMDKIYFPIYPIYERLRVDVKKQKMIHQKIEETLKKDSDQSDTDKKQATPEDLEKGKIESDERRVQRINQEAQREYEEKKELYAAKFQDFIYNMHGKFINEEDFTNGEEGYKEFIELYLQLYYEPLDEEYDEKRYFTKAFDDNLLKKFRFRSSRKIISIEIK